MRRIIAKMGNITIMINPPIKKMAGGPSKIVGIKGKIFIIKRMIE